MTKTVVIATQCFPPDVGGIETLVGQLAGEVARAGYRVEVFADAARSPGDDGGANGLAVSRFGGLKIWRRLVKARAVSRAMSARRSEIAGVICDSWKSLEHLTIPAGMPVLVLAHGMEFPPDASARKARRITATLQKATAVVASSHYAADLVRTAAGGEALATVTVINPPILAQPEPAVAALAEIGAHVGDRLVIAGLGRLEPRKGFDKVICAIGAVREAVPGSIFVLAGSGNDRPRLEALAAEAAPDGSVIFLGRIDDDLKAALLTRADVFAMPVRREGASVEGFGIVYLEAAWYGTPAVAGRDGGAVDAVIDGTTGLVVDGTDGLALAEALTRLARDRELRARLGEAALRRVQSECLWSARIGDYLALLDAKAKSD